MSETVSKLRLRKVRTREREAERAAERNPISGSPVVMAFFGMLGFVLALWLILPPGLDPADAPARVGAHAAIVMLTGLSLHLLLSVVAPEWRGRGGMLAFTGLCVIASLAGSRALHLLADSPLAHLLAAPACLYLAPYALAPMLVGLLFGGPSACAAGLAGGLLLAVQMDLHLETLLHASVATLIVAAEMPRLRSRMGALRPAVHILFGQVVVLLAVTLLTQEQLGLGALVGRIGALAAGVVTAMVVGLGVLPAAERLCRRTSHITLNSFADLGRPLLQRLALEAPGTYHHSLMVANLAQTAADRIGANGLLARVGAYYHDIGKLCRPGFFIENHTRGANPHDELPPNISRMIITNHVKEGICLGRLHRLPPSVLDVIHEHHGTSVIRWFHHKARSMAASRRGGREMPAGEAGVEESHYRYGGPLPVSRETTIVSLADSIEAASRSMARVTPAHIENLVARIIEYKQLDGQLAASGLSCGELTVVRNSFIFTLTHLLHARIAYPSHDTDRNSEPATALSSAVGAAS